MKRTWMAVVVLTVLVLGSTAFAQEQVTEEATAAISPRLVRFSGTLKDARRSIRGGRAVMHFALYESQEGGVALWKESQLVQLEEGGRYTVLLGASEKEGLPLELFRTEKAQWLGVQVEGQEEQGRVVLVAVPYALRAADADTVGGASASRFVLNEDLLEAGGDFNAYRAILQQRGIIDRDGKLVKQNASTGVVGIISTTEVLSQAPIISDTAIQDSIMTSYGYNAGTSGNWASYFGSSAGSLNTTGAGNSYFGWGSGNSNTTGNDNSFFGAGAGYSNTASNNSFFGQNSGNANTTGNYNSFFGRFSGRSNTGGNYNSFFGGDAGNSNTTGYDNSFVGTSAGYYNTTGYYNSFFGSGAGYYNTTGSYNSLVGMQAGSFNTTGSYNSFLGYRAGFSNTTGNYSSFIGYQAGYLNTEGNWNSFVGHQAGYSNTTGYANSFVGMLAGSSNTTGNYNSFFGADAGLSNTTGSDNSFVGNLAGYYNTTGHYNSFFGWGAGFSNTEGIANSFVGYYAGLSNTTEHYNSYLGAASDGVPGITNGTAVGYRAKVTQSNSLVLGSINGVNGADADVNVGIGTTAPQHRLHVVSDSGYAGYFEGNVHIAGRFSFDSDARLKKDVRSLGYGLREVMQLRPVSYSWKNRSDERPSFGLIAQEVETILPQLVGQTDSENGTLTMDYVSLVPVLIKAIQEQQDTLSKKDVEISTLKAQNALLDARLTALERMMERFTEPQLAKLQK